MQKKIIVLTGVLLTLVVSFAIFKLVYNEVYPLGGVSIQFDANQIKDRASEFLKQRGIDLSTKLTEIKLKRNNDLQEMLQLKYGTAQTNELAKTGVPIHYWNVRILDTNDSDVVISNNSANTQNAKDTDIHLNYNTSGDLLEFVSTIRDTSETVVLEIDDARREAELFVTQINPDIKLIPDSSYLKLLDKNLIRNEEIFVFKEQSAITKNLKSDYRFSWQALSPVTNKPIILTVEMTGRDISKYAIEYTVDSKETGINYISTILIILFIVIVTIALIITAYRRIKAYELGFKIALWVGLFYSISFGFTLYSEVNMQQNWASLIPLIFGGLFLGGAAVITWAISESVSRDVWKEKLTSLDLLMNGHLFDSRFSISLLRGVQFGTALAAFWLVLLFIAGNITTFAIISKESKDLVPFHSIVPSFALLNNAFFAHLFMIPVFFLFTLSGLRKRISNDILLLIFCGIIWGLIGESGIKPFYIGNILDAMVGIILAYIFYKYDLITTAVSVFTFFPLLSGFVFLNLDGDTYTQTAFMLLGVYLLILLFSVAGYLTKDKLADLDSITPVFVKNITERQRMQRELEIARDVQMSFLPKSNPDFKGLDIAAKCYPALEVGGDYYDFVRLSENKIGVIIGDVSGKGTQAAFYMTLTKGFLRAISKTSESPAEVLTLMNELFYDNVERGTFISMIYGIFDNEKKIFKLARAGHNPVIVRNSARGKVEMLNPTGLALGLEKGLLFGKTISELEINYDKDDVFVFYTDGFTEAMNKKQEEFTEERLLDSVHKLSSFTAEESITKIHKEVSEFIGKAPQHDDMTIVIIRVKE